MIQTDDIRHQYAGRSAICHWAGANDRHVRLTQRLTFQCGGTRTVRSPVDEAVLAMTTGIPYATIGETIHVHPTLAEGVNAAAGGIHRPSAE